MAFWFNSRDSVTRVAAVPRLLSLILMGVLFISPCRCVPIKQEIAADDPWWCQPCKSEHKTRHSRGINDPLKNTFQIAINSYETQISKYVKQLHTKLQIGNMTKKQLKKNNWLPRRKFFKSLRKDDEKILPDLHYQVQIYAVTIQRLLNMEIRSQDGSFDSAHRTNILNIVKSNINLLRCETEQEIAEKQLKEIPKKVPANFVDKKIPAAVEHITDGLLQDFTILKDYYNFLKKCYSKIFGKIKKIQKNKKQDKQDKPKSKKRTKNTVNDKVNES